MEQLGQTVWVQWARFAGTGRSVAGERFDSHVSSSGVNGAGGSDIHCVILNNGVADSIGRQTECPAQPHAQVSHRVMILSRLRMPLLTRAGMSQYSGPWEPAMSRLWLLPLTAFNFIKLHTAYQSYTPTSIELTHHYTFQYSTNTANFLDLTVYKGPCFNYTKIHTKTYQKLQNLYQYIHFTSNHKKNDHHRTYRWRIDQIHVYEHIQKIF